MLLILKQELLKSNLGGKGGGPSVGIIPMWTLGAEGGWESRCCLQGVGEGYYCLAWILLG